MKRLTSPYLFFCLLPSLSPLIAAEKGEPLAWEVDGKVDPLRYRVKIVHEEKGDPFQQKVELEFEARVVLLAALPRIEAVWHATVEWLKVAIQTPAAKHAFDSNRRGAPPGNPPLKPYAEFLGKSVTLRVVSSGKVVGVSGLFKALRGPGGLEIGAEPDTSLAKGLLMEALIRMFHLPSKAPKKESGDVYCVGFSRPFPSMSPYTLNLAEAYAAKRPGKDPRCRREARTFRSPRPTSGRGRGAGNSRCNPAS
ncbi:MAG: hypothetical protein ACYTHN_04225 [Planctomycetota bacterium]|jgi:hypothetical protein